MCHKKQKTIQNLETNLVMIPHKVLGQEIRFTS